MSAFSIERVLWEICNDPNKIGQFIEAPEQLLASYSLSEDETELVRSKNVRAMADQSVSEMLLMLFWMAVSGGDQSLPEYLQRMNTPA